MPKKKGKKKKKRRLDVNLSFIAGKGKERKASCFGKIKGEKKFKRKREEETRSVSPFQQKGRLEGRGRGEIVSLYS